MAGLLRDGLGTVAVRRASFGVMMADGGGLGGHFDAMVLHLGMDMIGRIPGERVEETG